MSRLHIRRIEISDFRGIRGARVFELVAPNGSAVPQYVLAGPNGSGKTSVLEAVLQALGRGDLLVRDLPKDEREGNWRALPPPGARIRVTLDENGRDGEVLELPLGTGKALRKFESVAYFSSWRSPYLVGAVEPLGRGRRPDDTESNRLWRLKQRIIDEKAKTGFGAQPASAARHALWLDRLNAAWTRLHGDDGTAIAAELVDPNSENAYADLFVTKAGQRVCSVDQASSGELELLSLAGWIILSGFEDGILVIDEPELHLHPEWQASILPALRELAPRAQFLVATHADAPWDAAFTWERALLVPSSDPRSSERRRVPATPAS